jgi:hypothetical protein
MTAVPPSHRPVAEPPWRPLAAAAAVTVGLHLGVLGVWPGAEQMRGASTRTSTSSASTPSWQVRTLKAGADRPAPAHDLPGTTPKPGDASSTAAPTPSPAADPLAPAARRAPAIVADPPGDGGDEEYLPRRRLTRPPQAAQLLIPYPEQAPLGHWEVRLTLFIDQQGQVRRVRPAGLLKTDDPDSELPAELLDAAVQTFLSTRYTPGELRGRAVKSRIDVAVAFSADAPPRSAAGD